MNETLVDLLKRHEGVQHFPYTDTAGKTTIGAGRNLTDNGLSPDEVEYLLQNDIKTAEHELDRLFPRWRTLQRQRRWALVSMMFNLGAPKYLTFHKFWKAMLEGDYETAANEMLDSKWANQVGSRAVELADMMRSPEHDQ